MAAWPIYFIDRGQNRFERLSGTVGKATNVPSGRKDPKLSEHLHFDERSAAAFTELNAGHHYFENRARPYELGIAVFFVTSAQSLSRTTILGAGYRAFAVVAPAGNEYIFVAGPSKVML